MILKEKAYKGVSPESNMEIPKVVGRRVAEYSGLHTKQYLLETCPDIEVASGFMDKVFRAHAEALLRCGRLSIGFAFDYGTLTADLFTLTAADAPWSETVPARVRQRNSIMALNPIEDFCDAELEILEVERKYRKLCCTTPGTGFEAYRTTFPLIDQHLIDARCPCLLDSSFCPIDAKKAV